VIKEELSIIISKRDEKNIGQGEGSYPPPKEKGNFKGAQRKKGRHCWRPVA